MCYSHHGSMFSISATDCTSRTGLAIGWLQIGGGILSILAFTPDISRQSVSFAVLGMALCLGVIISGRALVNNSRNAARWALIVQGIQLLQGGRGTVIFECILGPRLQLVFAGNGMVLNIGMLPALVLQTQEAGLATNYIGLNLVPLVCLVLLARNWP